MTPDMERVYERLTHDLREDAIGCTCEDGEPYIPLCIRCDCIFSIMRAIEDWLRAANMP